MGGCLIFLLVSVGPVSSITKGFIMSKEFCMIRLWFWGAAGPSSSFFGDSKPLFAPFWDDVTTVVGDPVENVTGPGI